MKESGFESTTGTSFLNSYPISVHVHQMSSDIMSRLFSCLSLAAIEYSLEYLNHKTSFGFLKF